MSAALPASGHTQALSPIPAWVVVTALGLLTGLQPLTTDLYLPALPQMQRHADEHKMQAGRTCRAGGL